MNHCQLLDLTVAQFTAVEYGIIKALKWKLNPPTYYNWLSLYLRKSTVCFPDLFPPPPNWSSHSAMYPPEPFSFRTDIFSEANSIIDVFIHYPDCLSYPPSIVAAGAYLLACESRFRSGTDEFVERVEGCVGYDYSAFEPCAARMRELVIYCREEYPNGVFSAQLPKRAHRECFQPEYKDLHDYVVARVSFSYICSLVDHSRFKPCYACSGD